MVQSSHSQLCKINSCFVKLDGGPLDHNSGKVLVENSRILILQNNFKNLFLNDKKNATQGTVQFAEAVVPRCSVKKVFLEILEKTWSSILLKRGAWLRCFPVNFAKFLTFFNRTPSVGAFVVRNTKKMKHFQQKGNLKKSKRNRVNFFNTYIVVFAFLSSVVEVGRL